MAHTVKMAQSFAKSKAFEGYVRCPYNNPFVNAKNDDELHKAIKERSIVLFHGSGTAAMSPKNAEWGVLDPREHAFLYLEMATFG